MGRFSDRITQNKSKKQQVCNNMKSIINVMNIPGYYLDYPTLLKKYNPIKETTKKRRYFRLNEKRGFVKKGGKRITTRKRIATRKRMSTRKRIK